GVDVDCSRRVLGKVTVGNGYAPPAKPHAGTLTNVSITGNASNNSAVTFRGRPDSVVDNCCIQQEGEHRDGVVLDDSDGSVVRDSTIDVTGRAVRTPGCSANTSNISNSGSCPVPNHNAGGGDLPQTLSIETTNGRASYTFSVSGDLEKSTANGASIDDNDSISGSTAVGQGGDGGIDSYAFSGELVSFDLDGEANVILDGEPAHVGQLPDHALIIDGAGSRTEYSFSVSGNKIGRATRREEESISDSTATGAVGDGGRGC